MFERGDLLLARFRSPIYRQRSVDRYWLLPHPMATAISLRCR
jgi:hypothetical protein